MRWRPLFDFMHERHRIYVRRQQGQPWPWTKNYILQEYRFCNVYRELDTVTRWVDTNIRQPYEDHEHLWFFLAVARHVNWPDTLGDLLAAGVLPRWGRDDFVSVLRSREERGLQVYTGAYIINGVWPEDYVGPTDGKPYLSAEVLNRLWIARGYLTRALGNVTTLQEAQELVQGHYHGWGGFMTYEWVSDLRHTRYLRNATDVGTWAHAGPGAKRGLVRCGWDGEPVQGMRRLLRHVGGVWPFEPALEMRDIEHSLCEFDKYERVRLGEGRPRSRYHYRGEAA